MGMAPVPAASSELDRSVHPPELVVSVYLRMAEVGRGVIPPLLNRKAPQVNTEARITCMANRENLTDVVGGTTEWDTSGLFVGYYHEVGGPLRLFSVAIGDRRPLLSIQIFR